MRTLPMVWGFFLLTVLSCCLGAGPVGQPTSGPSEEKLTSEMAMEVATEAFRSGLRPQIAELLALPRIHRVAAPGTLAYAEQWPATETLVPFFFRAYRFDVPLSLIRDPDAASNVEFRPSVFLADPGLILANDWTVRLMIQEDSLAPSLAAIEWPATDGVPGQFRSRAQEYVLELRQRMHFRNDFEVYKKLWSTSFKDVDVDQLGVVDLVETWTLLKVKSVAEIAGADAGVAFARTPFFPAIVWGSLKAERRLNVHLHDGASQFQTSFFPWHFGDSLSQEQMNESVVECFVASVRRHDSGTPGGDLRAAAAAVLRPPQTPKARMVGRYLLLLALQYGDGVDQSRGQLRSLFDPSHPHYSEYLNILAWSEQGRCLVCGKARDVHGRQGSERGPQHEFVGPGSALHDSSESPGKPGETDNPSD